MSSLWDLPRHLTVDGKDLAIDADFRTVLQIFRHFQDERLPEFLRWEIALALFYKEPVPDTSRRAAMEALGEFITCGRAGKPGPKLLDWDHDAMAIVADVNRVAGREVRELEFLHWWTFLGWFHAIGEGQLSGIVDLRRKMATGQKLDEQERRFYRENRALIDLPRRSDPQKERLNALINGQGTPPVSLARRACPTKNPFLRGLRIPRVRSE